MAKILAEIRPATTGGPFYYFFMVDGVVKQVADAQPNLGTAFDAVKGLVAAEPGNITHVRIAIETDT